MNTIILLSYLFYFIAATASPLQRRWLATKEISHEGQIQFAFYVVCIINLFGLFIPLFSPFRIQGNLTFLFLLAFITGLSGMVHFVNTFAAQKHVEAGITTLVLNIYTPVAIILATIFLNEKLTIIQIMGTFLLLIGMIVVSKKHKIGKFKFDKYFLLMILGGVSLGVLLTAERALQKTTGFTAGILFSYWSQFLFLGLAVLLTKSRCHYSFREVGVTGILRFLQAISWIILLYVVGNLSVVSSVTTFKVVLIFIAAALILKEKEDMARKTLGSFIALLGLLLMR